MAGAAISLEDIAVQVVTWYGKSARYGEIYEVFADLGFDDPEGTCADRIIELIDRCSVKVKIYG